MDAKGYLTSTGRVVRSTKSPLDPGHRRSGALLALDGDPIVARIFYKETRFNLVRTLVAREWIVEAHPRPANLDVPGLRVSGSTRADAIERFLHDPKTDD